MNESQPLTTAPSKKNNQAVDSKRLDQKHASKVWGWLWSAIKYLLLFLVIYTAVNWWRKPVAPINPNLNLVDYQGQLIDVEKMSHQAPVLIYFWGSWCGVCRYTSPTIHSLSEDGDYPIVTIAIQSGDNSELHQYLYAHNYSFTTINDQTGDMFNKWQGQVTPSYVIVHNGEVTQGLTGIQPKWSLNLRLWLSSLG